MISMIVIGVLVDTLVLVDILVSIRIGCLLDILLGSLIDARHRALINRSPNRQKT